MIGAEVTNFIRRDRLSARFDLFYRSLVRNVYAKGQEVAALSYIFADCARISGLQGARFDGQIAGFAGFFVATTPILAPKLANDLFGF